MDDGGVGAYQVTCGASGSVGVEVPDPTDGKDDVDMAGTEGPSLGATGVGAAVRDWQAALIDLSRRNPLLYYKDLSASTLDLESVPSEVVTSLVKGKSLRVGDLFNESTTAGKRDDAVRRLRAIHRKVAALAEERGVRAGYLALGMATWHDPGYQPAAPVLLYPVDITPTGSRHADFRLEIDDDPAVNPVLLEYLATQAGIDIGDDQFPIPTDANPDSLLSLVSRQLLRSTDGRMTGFRIHRRQVVAAFSYAKLPMVKDLEAAGALLRDHDVIAAVSGDAQAQQRLRSTSTDPVVAPDVENEFLVLDADSSQSEAVNAAAAGHSLVVQGPPGTGKSQTIVNLIATMIAQGKRVLFVAEKRAAIDVVMRRITELGLDDLVMDAHDGATARHRIVDKLKNTLDKAGDVGKPDVEKLQKSLRRSSETLQTYRETVFGTRKPWERSVFAAQCRLLELGDGPTVPVDDDTLDRLDPHTAENVRKALREYVDLGGLTMSTDDTAWFGAHLSDVDEVTRALTIADELVQLLPRLEEAIARVATTTRTRLAASIDGFAQRLELLNGIARTEKLFDPIVWSVPLPEWLAATGTRRWRADHDVSMRWLRRRRLRRQIAAVAKGETSRRVLHERLSDVADRLDAWNDVSRDGTTPFVPADLPADTELLKQIETHLAELATVFDRTGLEKLPLSDVVVWAKQLASDRVSPPLVARLRQLRQRLDAVGLETLTTTNDPVVVFDRSFARALVDRVAKDDPRFHRVSGEVLRAAREEFVTADAEHVASNPGRIRRIAAERLYAARDRHPTQETFLRKQLVRKRRQASLRVLFDQAPDIVTAVTPCVAMSPLVVSQQLPARRLFDVVVFDEASQIPVSDAVPSIMRADRVVVTGDTRQLPPTRFFASAEQETDDEDLSVASGLESILESLEVLLPTRTLTWHYRSRDERLIDFSNRHVYNGRLITFAGREPAAVRHILCHDDESPVQAEVDRVVELILEHAHAHPDETLGVITMNVKHARRIDDALERARAGRPELDRFFAPDNVEPFFVKNLERVQGDERDAIIMSLGYAKSPQGRMRHHFGPLNHDGGHRRLNVAVTRAKRRMVTVSTFGADDLDPQRLNAAGARMLRGYLEYAAAGGAAAARSLSSSEPLNAFERDVRERLAAAEMPVIARYGASRHRIDIAVPHPRDRDRMVLAIDVDGLGLPDDLSVRDRDRLRGHVLSRLGWAVHRIWSPDWFADPMAEVLKAREAYNAAIVDADKPDTASVRPPAPRTPEAVAPKPRSRRKCPIKTPRKSIRNYSDGELVMLIQWINEDRRLRTDDELIRDAIKALGFSRRGPRIVEALTRAITAVRQPLPEDGEDLVPCHVRQRCVRPLRGVVLVHENGSDSFDEVGSAAESRTHPQVLFQDLRERHRRGAPHGLQSNRDRQRGPCRHEFRRLTCRRFRIAVQRLENGGRVVTGVAAGDPLRRRVSGGRRCDKGGSGFPRPETFDDCGDVAGIDDGVGQTCADGLRTGDRGARHRHVCAQFVGCRGQ